MLRKVFLVSTFCSLALSSIGHAGTLHVVNENDKAIDIKIEAEGDSSAVVKYQVSKDRESSFEATRDQLNGKSYFSIKGDTSAFTSGGKCDRLNVEKDYKITFLNDTVGTTCLSEEISQVDGANKSDK